MTKQSEPGAIRWLLNSSDSNGENETTSWFEADEEDAMRAEARLAISQGFVVRIAQVVCELRPRPHAVFSEPGYAIDDGKETLRAAADLALRDGKDIQHGDSRGPSVTVGAAFLKSALSEKGF